MDFRVKVDLHFKEPQRHVGSTLPYSTLRFLFFLFSQLLYTHEHQSLFPVLRWFPLSSPVACGTHVWGVVYVILHLLYSTLVCSLDLMSFDTFFLIFCRVTDWLMSFPSCCLLGSVCFMFVWHGTPYIYIACIK